MAPYEKTLKSTAYEEMRKKHPAEFEPASISFTHDARRAIDRRNSFQVKAALVYEALSGHHVDDPMRANRFLLVLAEACYSDIHGGSSSPQKNPDGNGVTTQEVTKQKTTVVEDAGGNGLKTKTEEVSKLKNVEEGGGGNEPKKIEEKSKEKTGEENADEDWDEKRKRVVDGIFLVVGFLPELMRAIDRNDRDGVDESFRSRHMNDIVTDVIKLENQLQLKDLLDVARVVEGAITSTVGKEEFKDVDKDMGGKYEMVFDRYGFDHVVNRFCWYYSPFSSNKPKAPTDGSGKGVAGVDDKKAARTLLDRLHESVVPQTPAQGSSRVTGSLSSMPTARELRRSGIRFHASDTGRAGIEFKEQGSTLTLPALVFDFKLATVAHNLRARELDDQSKPVTRYFQMMNELVKDAVDARILRRARVLRGGTRGEQEAHQVIQSIDGQAKYPSVYLATDRQIEMVRTHYEKRMKSFFVRNRPGVIWASSVATAVSVVAVVAARRIRG